MNRARAVLTALVLASALSLAGCTDDDPEPKFESPSSEPPESPSTTAASGSTAPEMPDAAKGSDAAAAEAFVKYYWDTVDYAQTSGDLDGLEGLAGDECDACAAGLRYLQRVYSKGGAVSGGDSEIRVLKTGFVRSKGRRAAVVRFRVTTTPQEVTYAGDTKDESYPGGTRIVNALLTREQGGWRMFTWSVEQ